MTKSPRDPETWRVQILKDTDITWPTIVDKKVTTAEAAAEYLKAHPGVQQTPGTFMRGLARAAGQTMGTRP
jgi:hypothetical protein